MNNPLNPIQTFRRGSELPARDVNAITQLLMSLASSNLHDCIIDNTGIHRRIRIPAMNPHKAYVKDIPGATPTVNCYLDIDSTGEEIIVTCSIVNGSNLNAAVPRITDGDLIFVVNFNGEWHCLTTFQASEDCDCYSAP